MYKKAKLRNSFAINKDEVKALFTELSTGREFYVTWEKDADGVFDISLSVGGDNFNTIDRVERCIEIGEDHDSHDVVLYLEIIEQFGMQDAEELAKQLKIF